ncbi:MAG TPA: DUF6152 family protein [Bryobacteraceae bacterium]|nr:DUF6152 family protein [Bryobacteraceae bacterium]
MNHFKKQILFLACTFVLTLGLAGAAYGHHSMAGFDRNKTVNLVGTIRQFKWANPHSWIEMEVPNDKGGVDIWNVEMTSPAVLIRAGWKSNLIKPGDKVTIACHPLQSGEPGGIFVSVTLPSGQTYTDRPAPSTAAKQ